MDFSPNGKRPEQGASRPEQGAPVAAGGNQSVARKAGKKVNKLIAALVSVLILLILAFGAWFLVTQALGGADTKVKQDQYQAVFLTNGQVYFGDLKSVEGDYLELENIYYLQAQQSVQPEGGQDEAKADNADQQAQQGLQLIKLGNELHGPEDQMLISADQVIFWENLKDGGKVAKAIENYQSENN